MSKTALRKAVKNLDDVQLRELIAEIYNVCPDARHYLDFYSEPDVKALTDDFAKRIAKEFSRGKRGYCRARFSEILKTLKLYAKYGIEPRQVIEFAADVLVLACQTEWSRYVQQSYFNGTARLVAFMIETAEQHGIADKALQAIDRALALQRCSDLMHTVIDEATQQTVQKLAVPALRRSAKQ